MEETRKALEDFFDEMLGSTRYFKKKSYEGFFKEAYEKHRSMIMSLPGLCGKEEADGEQVIEELAAVIPSYAKSKCQDLDDIDIRRLDKQEDFARVSLHIIQIQAYGKPGEHYVHPLPQAAVISHIRLICVDGKHDRIQ